MAAYTLITQTIYKLTGTAFVVSIHPYNDEWLRQGL
jgi:hypothetical protein